MTHDPLCPNAKGCSHDCGGCSCNADAFCQCDLITKVRLSVAAQLREYGKATHPPHGSIATCLRCDIHAAYDNAAAIAEGAR